MLRIKGLTKRYRTGDLALKGIDIDVPDGQVMALIGPSGAGKSTVIRCVNRLVEPTSGSVELNGVDIVKLGSGELRRARRRMTADEHPTNISAPQIAAAKRTIINLAPGLAPQSARLIGGAARVLAAEMGLFFDCQKFRKMRQDRIFETKTRSSRCFYMQIRAIDEKNSARCCHCVRVRNAKSRAVLHCGIRHRKSDRHAASREDEWCVWILRDCPDADGQNGYDLSRGKRHFCLRLFPADFAPSQDSQSDDERVADYAGSLK